MKKWGSSFAPEEKKKNKDVPMVTKKLAGSFSAGRRKKIKPNQNEKPRAAQAKISQVSGQKNGYEAKAVNRKQNGVRTEGEKRNARPAAVKQKVNPTTEHGRGAQGNVSRKVAIGLDQKSISHQKK